MPVDPTTEQLVAGLKELQQIMPAGHMSETEMVAQLRNIYLTMRDAHREWLVEGDLDRADGSWAVLKCRRKTYHVPIHELTLQNGFVYAKRRVIETYDLPCVERGVWGRYDHAR